MKKAIVLTDHFGNGGAERVASLLISGLSKLPEMEVHVCVFEDINNYSLDLENVRFHLLTPPGVTSYLRSILKRIKRLKKVIKEERPDVIFSFGPIMAIYVRIATSLAGVKGIKIVDSERNDPRREPVSDIKKRLRDKCYKKADVLVCQTRMAVDLLKGRGIDTRYVIIPNPITPGLPEWKGENSKEIITACRLTEQKNLPMLINAFRVVHEKHPEYHLTIYGDGELRDSLERQITTMDMSDCISMPGFAKDIHSIMSNACMYVSSSDYEGISNSMLESLGIGLPTVCTDCPVGGAATFIENEKSGLLTPVGDGKALANAMCRFIEDPVLTQLCSSNSRKINSELTLDKITAKWCELID